MAFDLPLELQQQILQYLDPRSFHASRNVCRWWRYAAKDSVTLASQLRQMPIQPLVSAKKLRPEGIQKLYDEAARTLMLGMTVSSGEFEQRPMPQPNPDIKIAVSGDSTRMVSLEDRKITLYDNTTPEHRTISQRPLNDLRCAIGGGPWFKCAPTSTHELALSSDGSILAIAMERTIQIYDMTAAEDSWPVSSYISSAAGHYIAGIMFEHNDSLLRVQLSNKGTVLYLGTPQDSSPRLEHWQAKEGLKHAYLDSSKAVVVSPVPTSLPERLAGLQLLRTFGSGWLFAAQKHCTTTHTTSYCIGYVASSKMHGHVATTERNATILAELPSAKSACLPENVSDLWQDLPLASTPYPQFSLSGDSRMLAVAEHVSVPCHAGGPSRMFVYRLPTTKGLQDTLKNRQAAREAELEKEVEIPKVEKEQGECEILRFPINLGSVEGKMFDLYLQPLDSKSESRGSYSLSAVTQVESKTWSLLDG